MNADVEDCLHGTKTRTAKLPVLYASVGPSVSEWVSHHSSHNSAVMLRRTTSPLQFICSYLACSTECSNPYRQRALLMFKGLQNVLPSDMHTVNNSFPEIISRHRSSARVLGHIPGLARRYSSTTRSRRRLFLEKERCRTENIVRCRYRTLRKGAPPLRRDTVALEASEKVESNAHSTKYATTVIGIRHFDAKQITTRRREKKKGLFPCRKLALYNVVLKSVQRIRF